LNLFLKVDTNNSGYITFTELADEIRKLAPDGSASGRADEDDDLLCRLARNLLFINCVAPEEGTARAAAAAMKTLPAPDSRFKDDGKHVELYLKYFTDDRHLDGKEPPGAKRKIALRWLYAALEKFSEGDHQYQLPIKFLLGSWRLWKDSSNPREEEFRKLKKFAQKKFDIIGEDFEAWIFEKPDDLAKAYEDPWDARATRGLNKQDWERAFQFLQVLKTKLVVPVLVGGQRYKVCSKKEHGNDGDEHCRASMSESRAREVVNTLQQLRSGKDVPWSKLRTFLDARLFWTSRDGSHCTCWSFPRFRRCKHTLAEDVFCCRREMPKEVDPAPIAAVPKNRRPRTGDRYSKQPMQADDEIAEWQQMLLHMGNRGPKSKRQRCR